MKKVYGFGMWRRQKRLDLIFPFYILVTTFPLSQKYREPEVLEQEKGAMEIVYDDLSSGNALETGKTTWQSGGPLMW